MLFLRGSPAGSPADLTIFSALALVIDSLVSFFPLLVFIVASNPQETLPERGFSQSNTTFRL